MCCEDVELGIVGRGGIGEEKSGGRTGGSRDCDRRAWDFERERERGRKKLYNLFSDFLGPGLRIASFSLAVSIVLLA